MRKGRLIAVWGLSLVGAVVLYLSLGFATYWANGTDNIDYGVNGLAPSILFLLAGITLGGSLLFGLGFAFGTGTKLCGNNRTSRLGVLGITAGAALMAVSLALPWSEVSVLQNAYPYCTWTFHFSNWYLQGSGSGCFSSVGTDWWYQSSTLFSHTGAVALYCGVGVVGGIALSVIAVAMGGPSKGPPVRVARHPRVTFFAGLGSSISAITSATVYAAALPSAMSQDNGGIAQYYPYDHSFWGSETLAGPPATQYYWGPDWAWVLLFVAGAFTLVGTLLAMRGVRTSTVTTTRR